MKVLHKIARAWFWLPQWIDGLRHSQWNTRPVGDFRDAVWTRVHETGESFVVVANEMKWRPEWRGMYLRSQGLLAAWYASLALTLAPIVALLVAPIWWLSQHLTIG